MRQGNEAGIEERMGTPPLVAAAFAAGTVYAWLEAIFRLLGTFTALPTVYRLWQPRDGFITAMWLTMIGISLVVFLILGFGVFRRRPRVGPLALWVTVFVLSAIAAPLIGEIGTPLGAI